MTAVGQRRTLTTLGRTSAPRREPGAKVRKADIARDGQKVDARFPVLRPLRPRRLPRREHPAAVGEPDGHQSQAEAEEEGDAP